MLRAGKVYEDAAHHPRRHREEVGAVLPLHLADVGQTHIGFIDERGRLQRMARSLVAHISPREPPQLFVDQWRQPLQRGFVPSTPGQ